MKWQEAAARRDVGEWRDTHLLAAMAALNQVAINVLAAFEGDLKRAGWRDLALAPTAFVKDHIDRRVRDAAEPVAADLLARADVDLAVLGTRPTSATVADSTSPQMDGLEGWRDLTMTAGPVAVALGLAAALPTAAVSTGAAFLGLVTVTTISWPVVAVGGLVVSAALATGAANGARLKDKALERVRTMARARVSTILLAADGEPASVLAQITAALGAAVVRSQENTA